jgi:hypothetical protein
MAIAIHAALGEDKPSKGYQIHPTIAPKRQILLGQYLQSRRGERAHPAGIVTGPFCRSKGLVIAIKTGQLAGSFGGKNIVITQKALGSGQFLLPDRMTVERMDVLQNYLFHLLPKLRL